MIIGGLVVVGLGGLMAIDWRSGVGMRTSNSVSVVSSVVEIWVSMDTVAAWVVSGSTVSWVFVEVIAVLVSLCALGVLCVDEDDVARRSSCASMSPNSIAFIFPLCSSRRLVSLTSAA